MLQQMTGNNSYSLAALCKLLLAHMLDGLTGHAVEDVDCPVDGHAALYTVGRSCSVVHTKAVS